MEDCSKGTVARVRLQTSGREPCDTDWRSTQTIVTFAPRGAAV